MFASYLVIFIICIPCFIIIVFCTKLAIENSKEQQEQETTETPTKKRYSNSDIQYKINSFDSELKEIDDFTKFSKYERYNELMQALNDYQMAKMQFGIQILGSQPYINKRDSAILGGAASAMGGNLYGAAVYLKNEERNAEIDEHNKSVSSYNIKTSNTGEYVLECMEKADKIFKEVKFEYYKELFNIQD